MTTDALARMPLFYRQPQPLHAQAHADLRLTPGGFGFARETNAVPLVAAEFAAAMRDYPVVFSGVDNFPVAVFGLDRANRFVDGEAWAEDHYVPAYVRRYPFVFADVRDDGSAFALAVDVASGRVAHGAGEGEPLFRGGQPSALTQSMMEFCRDFHAAHIGTQAFVDALVAQDLLVLQHADAKLASGRPMQLSGFKVVDAARFAALADEVVADWHRKGWLRLVHFHLNSLDRFSDLVEREGAVDAVAEIAPVETSDSIVEEPSPQPS
jgi:hypothetical protein